MKKHPTKVFLFLSIALLGMSLQAQSLQLSLEDAQRRAIETSKMLRVSKQKVVQADAKTDESNTAMLPGLKMQGSYTRLSDVGASVVTIGGQTFPISQPVLDNYNLNMTLTQVLFAGNRLSAAKEISEFSAKAAAYDLENDKMSTTYAVTLTYWALYKAQDMRNSVAESVKQLEARVKDGQNLFKAGMITNNEVLKLQVQLANTKVQHIDIDQQCGSLMVALNNQIGQPLTTQIALSSIPTAPTGNVADVQSAIVEAQKVRPDFLANEMRIHAADRSIDVANGGWWPQVSASAQYVYANPNTRFFPQHASFDGTWSAGVNLQWDLWNWMTPKYQAAQAAAQKAQAEDGLSALRDGMSVEATQNYLALAPSKERISVAEEALQQAIENNTITASRYKAGTATGTDVIESETLLLQSKVNKISAIVDYELAVAKLNRSLGK